MSNQWPAQHVEMRSIDTLIAYARNARKHSERQVAKIAASIREFGWTIPVLIAEDSTLIAGHGRILAAKKLGITEIPVMIATGWTETQRKAYVIADNQLTLAGEWDEELLKIELIDLKASGFNLELTGFEAKELCGYISSDKEEKEFDEDETPEEKEETTVKVGDLYILGKHRVLCGDNSNEENIKRLFAGQQPDACISDPPYGINFNTNYKRFTTGFDVARTNHKPINDDDKIFDPRPYLHYTSVVLWGANYFAEHLPFGTWLVWDKRFDNGKAFLSDAELAWMKTGTGVYIKSITSQGFVRPEKVEHPTQKPIELMVWCIEKSKAGDIIFDPFLGSGTTLMACEKLNKQCIGCEIEPKYVDVILRRWEKMTGEKAVLSNE